MNSVGGLIEDYKSQVQGLEILSTLVGIYGSPLNSVAVRIMLLNAIMLSAVLFTAASFDFRYGRELSCITCRSNFCCSTPCLPSVADTKSTQACCTRRKEWMESLSFAIDVAICTQSLKHAMTWLIQKQDRCFYAWAAWTFHNIEDTAN